MMLAEIRDWVLWVQVAFLFASVVFQIMALRHMRWLYRGAEDPARVLPEDCTDEQASVLILRHAARYLVQTQIAFLLWLGWVVTVVLHLIVSVLMRDWWGAAVDVAVLVAMFFIFLGPGGRRRWRKRVTERVAVIKDRLVIVPTPQGGAA